jgi:hypothetical protein
MRWRLAAGCVPVLHMCLCLCAGRLAHSPQLTAPATQAGRRAAQGLASAAADATPRALQNCLQPHLKRGCLRGKPPQPHQLAGLQQGGGADNLAAAAAMHSSVPSHPAKGSAHLLQQPPVAEQSLTGGGACRTSRHRPAWQPRCNRPAPPCCPEPAARVCRRSQLTAPAPRTRAGCLWRYVRPEQLGAAADWRCSQCSQQQRPLKQMSVRKLPPVLCFHLKRFEHGHKQRARKLDVPIRFPVGRRPCCSMRQCHLAPGPAAGAPGARTPGAVEAARAWWLGPRACLQSRRPTCSNRPQALWTCRHT